MQDLVLLERLARQSGASELAERERDSGLHHSNSVLSTGVDPTSEDSARQRLIIHRKAAPYYVDPDKQKRNILRSKKEKERLRETAGWVFTKAERFAVVDQLIRQRPIPVAEVAAVLRENANDPLDVNECYAVKDPDGKESIRTGERSAWLNIAAEQNEWKCVVLLCECRADQTSKDEALGRALSRNARTAAKELLAYGANPNVSAGSAFQRAIEEHDRPLLDLLLGAPQKMQQKYIDDALIRTTGSASPELLALLFAHGAQAQSAGATALGKAAAGGFLEDMATILLHSQILPRDSPGISIFHINETLKDVCAIDDHSRKYQMLELLLAAGADADSSALIDELARAVRQDDNTLVKLLVSHGTSVDRNNAEVLRSALALHHLRLVTLLLHGHLSPEAASCALDAAASLKSLEDYEQVASELLEKGVSPASLHRCLAVAVHKGCDASFAQQLLSAGANIDHENAQAIRTVLSRSELSMFRTLMKGQSTPTVLCKALLNAVDVEPQIERFDTVNALLSKGVSGRELHVALQKTAHDKIVDYDLLRLLTQHGASVDFHDAQGNCLCTSVARNDERAVDLLVSGNPSSDTMSAALGVIVTSFGDSDASDYAKSIRMMQTLLGGGAVGVSASNLLIEAVRSDSRGKALQLLLDYKADANHRDGEAVRQALMQDGLHHLEQLCRQARLQRTTFVGQLPVALAHERSNLSKATLLAETATSYGYKGILDDPLLLETTQYGARQDVMAMLLGLGASVDHQDGQALRHAVSCGDVSSTKLLLSFNPSTSNVARAFPATMHIADLTTRFALMQSLLQSGGPGMGDEALVQAAREADPSNLSHVELLLQHKASPDCKSGLPLQEAVKAQNLPLVDMLLAAKPNDLTLNTAFKIARNLDCDREVRHELFIRLLRTGYKGFETELALIEVVGRKSDDIETSRLLLSHGASLEVQTGRAMQIVAAAGSLELLRVFIEQQPSKGSRDATMHAAIYAELDLNVRYDLYSQLLAAGVSKGCIDLALLEVTGTSVRDSSLLELLIDHGASLDAHDGAALENIAAVGDVDLLSVMLKGRLEATATLDRSLAACMALPVGPNRQNMVQKVLSREPGASVRAISTPLGQLVNEKHHSLLNLLADYKLDATHNQGEGLVIAAQQGDEKSTEILTRSELPRTIVDAAFQAMLDERSIRVSDGGLATAAILLSLGPSQKLIDQCLLDGFDGPVDEHVEHLVDLLIPFEPDFSAANAKVFVVAALARKHGLFKRMATQKPDLNVVVPALIESFSKEADDEPVAKQSPSMAIDETSEDMEPGPSPLQAKRSSVFVTVDELSSPTAFDETSQGSDIAETIETENDQLVEFRGTAEERLVFFLRILSECAIDGGSTLQHGVLFHAMRTFPKGVILVKHLLEHGCAANSKVNAVVDPSTELLRSGGHGPLEDITAVMWAIVNQEPVVSEAVILAILEREPEVEVAFQTTTTKVTATTLASAAGNCVILERLIELAVDPSTPDANSRSPLFYASRNGHLDTVKLLVAADCQANDGSLHEAAREAHFEILEFLLAHSHRSDYPSNLHSDPDRSFGRTALEELCLYSKGLQEEEYWETSVRRCIKMLLPQDLKDVLKTDGKTMLHLALENNEPIPMTRALLEFDAVWENINQSTYLFRDEDGLFYSPTKYVELLLQGADIETRQELVCLLHNRKCADRYYANTVTQPTGAIGLPDDVALAVDRHDRAEHEHSENRRRQEETFTRKRAVEAEDHQRRIQKDKERHDTLLAQQREQEKTSTEATARKHAQARSQAHELHQQRQTALAEEQHMRQQNMAQEEAQRRSAFRQARQDELEHMRVMAAEEARVSQQKMALERQMAQERASAAQAEQRAVDAMCARREQCARNERQERERALQASSYNNNY